MKRRKKLSRRRLTGKTKKGFLLEGIPEGLSPLSLAYRLTKKASHVGFDWPNVKEILKKFDEENKELREALSLQKRDRIRDEIGDLLFVIVNIARFLNIDPKAALMGSIEKFISRFRYVERALKGKEKTLDETSLPEMDQLWEEAKKKCRAE